jgi:hypothetical protein
MALSIDPIQHHGASSPGKNDAKKSRLLGKSKKSRAHIIGVSCVMIIGVGFAMNVF